MKLTSTPWGSPQQQHEIARGIISVSTASHGGLFLDDARWRRIMLLFPDYVPWGHHIGWLEEDQEVGLAILAWPHLFSIEAVYYAARSYSNGRFTALTRKYWASPLGKRVQAMANDYAASIADKWERGGLSCGAHTPEGMYAVYFTHVTSGESRTVLMAYPDKAFYTGDELDHLDALAKEVQA